jgi:hypothetical protein
MKYSHVSSLQQGHSGMSEPFDKRLVGGLSVDPLLFMVIFADWQLKSSWDVSFFLPIAPLSILSRRAKETVMDARNATTAIEKERMMD